ncbi:MAG: methyltransferase domain-containing protein [bacterium]|nr:methyltransferase domain-containing protein [bacterium]
MSDSVILDMVKTYYGSTLSSSSDLKTSACCSTDNTLDKTQRLALADIHPEIINRFYGCGSPIPPLLEGLTVLDLGCGTGRDVFLLSKLTGESGQVIGIDMTKEQLALGISYQQWHSEKFGYQKSNVSFRHGYIEDLSTANLADNSVDLVISNCVINLSPAKEQVFSEIFRVLKPGGELYFSDVFASQRIPVHLQKNELLRGECLSGALYLEDFRRMLARHGCHDYRTVSSSPIALHDDTVATLLGMVEFTSLTVRAFKLPLEDRCENFGHVAWYKGTIPNHPHSFALDSGHTFRTGEPVLVCGNTADMLSMTRYGEHFRVEGDKSVHFGLFDCSPTSPTITESTKTSGCC